MACLGIRPTKDIDLVCDSHDGMYKGTHNQFIEVYAGIVSYKEIVFGDHGYLWLSYKGKAIRFIPLHIFIRAKRKRALLKGDLKDVNDVRLLDAFMKELA